MKKYCIFATVMGFVLMVAGITLVAYFSSLGYDFTDTFTDYSSTPPSVTTVTAITETPLSEESMESHTRELSSADTASIKNIEIDASAAKVNFYVTYSDTIRIVTAGNGCNLVEVNVSSGELEIDYGSADIDFTDIKSIDLQSVVDIADSSPEIDIYIPEGMQLDSVSIELASGEMMLSDLITHHLDVQLAAGNVNMHRVTVFDDPEIELVAGDISISSSYFKDLDIETVSGGYIYISETELVGDTQIDTVTGSTDIYNFPGRLKDYDFDISVLTGYIRVNGENTVPENPGAANKITISKVTGDVYIEFAE